MSFDFGSFWLGKFFSLRTNSEQTIHNHHTEINIPVQYPDDWQAYSNEEKLKWLEDRKYWREYYELKSSLRRGICIISKQYSNASIDASINETILQSIIRNKGDTSEAKMLLESYLNEKFSFMPKTKETLAMINNVIESINKFLIEHRNEMEFYTDLELFCEFKFQ